MASAPDLARPPDLTPPPADLSTPPRADMFGLCCGQPGDPGNNLGVGKYCMTLQDCANNGQASLCAVLGDPMLHFCTFLCQQGGNCGNGATCRCNGNQCGCVPDSCIPFPNGC